MQRNGQLREETAQRSRLTEDLLVEKRIDRGNTSGNRIHTCREKDVIFARATG